MKKIILCIACLFLYSNAYPACTNQGADPDGSGTLWESADATQAEVSACVSEASNGDTIQIPNDTSTWTSGITTTKQIIIRAENYTATPAGTEGSGAATRNVILTNSLSSGHMFTFTTGDSYHVGLGGIRFNQGSSDGGVVYFSGSGTKPPKIFDCNFHDIPHRSSPAEHVIDFSCIGGIMWNVVMLGTSIDVVGESGLLVKSPKAWQSNSTMGMDDTNGIINLYFEDSTFTNLGIVPDIDDNGRFVARHCVYDGAWAQTHGFTSTWGGRHWEFYDNTFQITSLAKNLANRYFWARAGTGVFTENEVNNPSDPGEYGNMYQLNIGDNTSPGSYPQDRQPGGGWEDGNYVVDPIYMWSQTGARAYTYNFANGWDAIVVLNRDIFVNNGAKPGYTKYTYPHPLRNEIEEQETPANTIQGIQISNLDVTNNPIAWNRTDNLR